MTMTIGTISHGTHKSDDIAAALLPLAAEYDLGETRLHDLRDVIADSDAPDAQEIICEVIEDLSDFAPDYCYVGMHEGDGSDLGVWPDMDSVDEAVNCGDIIKIDDLSDLDTMLASECNATHALLVNDHGNCTLYTLTLGGPVEQWAIV